MPKGISNVWLLKYDLRKRKDEIDDLNKVISKLESDRIVLNATIVDMNSTIEKLNEAINVAHVRIAELELNELLLVEENKKSIDQLILWTEEYINKELSKILTPDQQEDLKNNFKGSLGAKK